MNEPTNATTSDRERWTAGGLYFEYSKAANPIAAGYITRVPLADFPHHLHEEGPTRVIPFDLSNDLKCPGPATSPALCQLHPRPGGRADRHEPERLIKFSKVKVDDIKLNGSTQLMQNIIGDNVGKIPALDPARKQVITNEVISLMNGVLNWKDPATVKDWYSAPTDTKANGGGLINNKPADFNVYNLNPFVWFVHKELGLTGYAFSVDDGISNVNAGDATKLLVSIGPITGTNGQNFPNLLKYGTHTPWGPVTLGAHQVDTTTLAIDSKGDWYKLGQIVAGATVRSNGGDVNPMTTVLGTDHIAHRISLKGTLVPSRKMNTYTFYDPGINGPV